MRARIASGLAAAFLLVTGDAFASYHEMKIVEVMAGPGSYVMLQMYNPGQNFTLGHSIVVYDASDNVLQTVQLSSVQNGEDNATILIGTTQTANVHGVTPDFFTLQSLPIGAGKVCFDPAANAVDCFAWGTYPNSPGSTGAPFAALSASMAAKRKIAGGTSADLDAADDTNNCFIDFVMGTPAPKANPKVVVDAGSTTSSSSSTSSTSSSSSSGEPTSSSTSSSSTSGVGTNPSSSSSSASSSGAAPAAAPASDDDGGCSTAGDTGALTAVPLLALAGVLAAFKRRRRY